MFRARPLALAFIALAGCKDEVRQPPPPTPPAAHAPAAAAEPAAGGDAAAKARAAYVRSHYAKFEFHVPMRDGVKLFTSVYVPNDASQRLTYPFLLVRTPYSVAPYGLDRYREHLGPSEPFEREGFIFVFQDVRGQHMSEGEFVNMRPQVVAKKTPADVDESTDTHDTITWLLANVANNNGKAGQWGISYPGFYSSAGAIDSHPALKAVSPQAPIADWFRGDDMHRHGAFNLQMAFGFFSGFGRPRPKPTDDEEWWKDFSFGTPDAYQFYLDLGPLSELDARHLKGDVAFWREIAAHPDYDAFWRDRNLLPHLKNIKAAMMIVGGWYDTEDLYGPLATYRAIEAQNPRTTNTLVMGPWQHGGWNHTPGDQLGDASFGFATSTTFQERELAFFKHHLKGGPDPELPEALVFETGANRWRAFSAWPPAGGKHALFHLREEGGLSFEPPTGDAPAFDEYLSDPAKPVPYTQEISERWGKNYMAEDQRFASRRPDVLVYATPPLENDLTLAGPLEAQLFVSTTGTDADFVVKLIDVNPGRMQGWTKEDEAAGKRDRGGQETLVRGEPFRARFREGYSTSKPLAPGEVTPIKFAMNDVFHTFQRGHRLMIQVQSSWFPFIDRNPQTFVPNIFEAKRTDFVKATQRVHRSRSAASAIKVTILPEG